MNEKKEYLHPQVKVCDYISRNGYCVDWDPNITGSDQLGKEDHTAEFEPETPTDESSYKRSVWDD
jgi:hypothetical protein